MSYFRKSGSPPARSSLGGIVDTIKTVTSGVSTAVDISTDPYLPETICRAKQLAAIEDRTTVPTCTNTRPGLQGGIGLRKAMVPLRAYVYAEQRPWVYPVAIAAVIGIPLLVGVMIGKGSR